ncbi:hypothetical protein [Jeotgalibacillus aurantiacus]|uniref:hypothetical protein n=1 Tax=Jeotgalibacillus aurantiacus TaxID=2763266 RepID=UPI001D0B15FE|nr:hypothetical protein [Jeotgalibacillus aurantiacus]
MKSKKIVCGSVLAMLLAGCSGELSESEVKEASSDEAAVLESATEKMQFELDLNMEYLQMVLDNSPLLSEKNDEKLGTDLEGTQLEIEFNNFITLIESQNGSLYETEVEGTILSTDGNFDLNGNGEMYKVQLDDGSTIYEGSYKGDINTKAGEDTFNLTLRYNPDTEEIDIVITSGVIYETAILPFGTPFLLQPALDDLYKKKNKVHDVN